MLFESATSFLKPPQQAVVLLDRQRSSPPASGDAAHSTSSIHLKILLTLCGFFFFLIYQCVFEVGDGGWQRLGVGEPCEDAKTSVPFMFVMV